MKAYRLYRLDGIGRIVSVEPLEAPSDGEAINLVRHRKSPVSYEIWDLGRRVAEIAPHQP